VLYYQKQLFIPDVIFLWGHQNNGFNINNVIRFEKCKKLVIDEDEMLNLGFRTQLTAILAMMPSKYSILKQ
jgi:superfamily II DNA/RNA helicase